ncbi:hypothetical protein PIB30_052910 [Stylosanthes scabra]|uniref:Uncharacterized protein n=1 Tax=Stylosanthes scabra TaxID=79078 RepID=A0ABU6UH24_9FABA|nr:hypothetical protein [Stylosanthes scabra]
MGTRRWGIFPVGTGIGAKSARGSGGDPSGESPTSRNENGESVENGDAKENSPVAGNGVGTKRDFASGDGEREGIPRPAPPRPDTPMCHWCWSRHWLVYAKSAGSTLNPKS